MEQGNDRERLKYVIIDIPTVYSILTAANLTECIEGLPDGAECTRVFAPPSILGMTGAAFFVFRHESFEVVAEGEPIPELPCVLKFRAGRE